MSNARECRFCDHCDIKRQNSEGSIRCTKFSKWTNRFSYCDSYHDAIINKQFEEIEAYIEKIKKNKIGSRMERMDGKSC